MQNRHERAGDEISHSYPTIRQEDIDAVTRCLTSRQLVEGEVTRRLEETVAADMGYPFAVATVNGSQALHLALRALFTGTGRRVGLQSYLCRTMYDAVILAGCEPVLLDIDEGTFSVSLQRAIQADLGAVVVPHMFGIRTDVEKYLEAGLLVIEDCAQRLVPQERWASEPKPPLRILSFSATKLLTGGEGGMVLTDDERVYERLCSLRDAPYDFAEPAVWLPYTDIQASLALAQWRRLGDFLAKRRRLAEIYLQELGDAVGVHVMDGMRRDDTHHFRFLLRVDDVGRVIDSAAESGIAFRRPLGPMALHELFGAEREFPWTEDAMAHVVSLPIYPELSEEDAYRVAGVAKESILKAGQRV